MSDTYAAAPDKAAITLSTHGVLVSIPSTLIKAAIAAVGVWFASKTGMDPANLQTWLAALVSGGALTSLGFSINASNEATKAAAAAGTLKA